MRPFSKRAGRSVQAEESRPRTRVDYLIIDENFWIGGYYFARGRHIRGDHPLVTKMLRDCPEWVHPVYLGP